MCCLPRLQFNFILNQGYNRRQPSLFDSEGLSYFVLSCPRFFAALLSAPRGLFGRLLSVAAALFSAALFRPILFLHLQLNQEADFARGAL